MNNAAMFYIRQLTLLLIAGLSNNGGIKALIDKSALDWCVEMINNRESPSIDWCINLINDQLSRCSDVDINDVISCDCLEIDSEAIDTCKFKPHPATEKLRSDIPDYMSLTHECGYDDCKLPKLNFRTLKIFSKCTRCFPGLEVSRVYEEFHGYDYGIEFSFKFGSHLQDYGEDDWLVFQRRNITSNLSGIFRIIRDTDDKQYIQWSRLKVVS